MTIVPTLRATAFVGIFALAAGCASSVNAGDAGSDARPDATPAVDSALDTLADSAPDAPADGTTDAQLDALPDTQPDAFTSDAQPDATQPDAPASCDCLAANTYVAWRYTGGNTIYDDSYRVDPCRTITATRTSGTQPTTSCSAELLPCGVDSPAIAEVIMVYNDPDVRTALAQPPVLYGVDPRPWDGAVFEIEIDGHTITVGEPCPTPDAGSCIPIPPGVDAARTSLNGVTQRAQSNLPCVAP